LGKSLKNDTQHIRNLVHSAFLAYLPYFYLSEETHLNRGSGHTLTI
jgi:hypothetical protein